MGSDVAPLHGVAAGIATPAASMPDRGATTGTTIDSCAALGGQP
eukprot:CAMPEP_0204385322 /NCGR_PEP_ID=MMETSP0469-20131031/57613_1 /ASSEMBLY_ACC=CAM_ASM_000384 /TAXON_ID=2969 /ORGANISM="Oxyrrhis marina" /LENGTH=43 /DNA_ID= /DNA_START= /DNA_END= /DNA_ORIENTATION=